MADTVRTLAALKALLADNSSGDISPQDIRDMLVSLWGSTSTLAEGDMLVQDGSGLWTTVSGAKADGAVPTVQADGSVAFEPGGAPDYAYDKTDNADAADIQWDGSQSAGMTQVTVTGTQTVTEKSGILSARYSGQSAGDYNALLAAHTFSIGDSFAVPIRLYHGNAAISVAGIVFTDGTTAAANAVAAHLQKHDTDTGFTRAYTRHGTLTAMSTVSTQHNIRADIFPWMWLRLTYQAANTFRKELSPDGVSWTTAGIADVSKTMTPTHFGLVWTVEGQTGEAIATYGPLVKLA